MTRRVKIAAKIPENQLGQRLDQALTKIFPDYSRSSIKKLIINKCVLVNGKIWDKPKKKVLGKEKIIINLDTEKEVHYEPQDIPLNIIYEDDDIIVINKTCGLVVHPGTYNPDGTILNALLNYYPQVYNLPRAGIIHRLDKDTTGLMVIAKNALAQSRLVKSLQLHQINREYEAIAMGYMTENGTIEQPIRRHPIKRTRMSVHPMGKSAITHYRIIEHFRLHTRLHIRLETGRKHQIRVHMSYINHPLVGDKIYSSRMSCLPKGASKAFVTALRMFNRQALHAKTLGLYHPISGIKMKWQTPIPQDMLELINLMHDDFKNYVKQL